MLKSFFLSLIFLFAASISAKEILLEEQLSPTLSELQIKTIADNFSLKYLIMIGDDEENLRNISKNFEEVYLIQNDSKRIDELKQKNIDLKNIIYIKNNEIDGLQGLKLRLLKNAFFYLPMNESSCNTLNQPQFQKILKQIEERASKNSVILVGDWFVLKDGYCIENSLLKVFNNNKKFYALGRFILGLPLDKEVTPSDLVQLHTYNILGKSLGLNSEKLLKAKKSLIDSLEERKDDFLKSLLDLESPVQLAIKNSPHASFYKGLAFFKEKNYLEASRYFLLAKSRGYDNWVTYWYIAQAEYARRNYSKARSYLNHVLKEKPEFLPAKEVLEKINSLD